MSTDVYIEAARKHYGPRIEQARLKFDERFGLFRLVGLVERPVGPRPPPPARLPCSTLCSECEGRGHDV